MTVFGIIFCFQDFKNTASHDRIAKNNIAYLITDSMTFNNYNDADAKLDDGGNKNA